MTVGIPWGPVKGQKVALSLGWLGGRDKDKDGMREKPSITMSGNFIQQTDQAEHLLLRRSPRSSPPHSIPVVRQPALPSRVWSTARY
jgi:hypothetical protein